MKIFCIVYLVYLQWDGPVLPGYSEILKFGVEARYHVVLVSCLPGARQSGIDSSSLNKNFARRDVRTSTMVVEAHHHRSTLKQVHLNFSFIQNHISSNLTTEKQTLQISSCH